MNPPSRAPTARVARSVPSSSSSRSSWASLAHKMPGGGARQLWEPRELAFVCAQNDGGGRLRDDGAQTLDVAVDMLGWRDRKALLGLGVGQADARERGE